MLHNLLSFALRRDLRILAAMIVWVGYITRFVRYYVARERIYSPECDTLLMRVTNMLRLDAWRIPPGRPADLQGGSIVARSGNLYVVTHGYPDRVYPDGAECWLYPGSYRFVSLE